MKDDKWKLKLTLFYILGFYIHTGGLHQPLKANNITLRSEFAYWLVISGIMLNTLQKII